MEKSTWQNIRNFSYMFDAVSRTRRKLSEHVDRSLSSLKDNIRAILSSIVKRIWYNHHSFILTRQRSTFFLSLDSRANKSGRVSSALLNFPCYTVHVRNTSSVVLHDCLENNIHQQETCRAKTTVVEGNFASKELLMQPFSRRNILLSDQLEILPSGHHETLSINLS